MRTQLKVKYKVKIETTPKSIVSVHCTKENRIITKKRHSSRTCLSGYTGLLDVVMLPVLVKPCVVAAIILRVHIYSKKLSPLSTKPIVVPAAALAVVLDDLLRRPLSSGTICDRCSGGSSPFPLCGFFLRLSYRVSCSHQPEDTVASSFSAPITPFPGRESVI